MPEQYEYTHPKRTTVKDVARRAEVSPSLVSLVMRGSPRVSRSRREIVLKAARELGYRPNLAARGMRNRTYYTIGVLLADIWNPFFPELIDGIEAELSRTDYQAMLAPATERPGKQERAIAAMLDRQFDGLILIAPSVPRSHLVAAATVAPMVVIGRHDEAQEYDSVVDDDAMGAALMVDHLASLGHRRIAYIATSGEEPSGRPETMPGEVRREGYASAMRRRGLENHVRVVAGPPSEQGGYRGAQLLLTNDRPTAIFAGNDITAVGALKALEDNAVPVPGDMSLAGYDNINVSALGRVSLTSVDQQAREMGGTAARLLLQRIEEGRDEAVRAKLEPSLVVRASTAPPAIQ